MDVTPNEIVYKKKIGNSNAGPVLEVATKGGWHMVVVGKGKTFETIGVGPHRGVARFIAQKKEPSMVLDALEKSDVALNIPPIMVERYELITDKVNNYFRDFSK